jgi:histidinol phosphatase-like enzyme
MNMARHSLTWALAAVLVFGSQGGIPQASSAAGQSAQTDNNIQADLQNQLKKFKDVESEQWDCRSGGYSQRLRDEGGG